MSQTSAPVRQLLHTDENSDAGITRHIYMFYRNATPWRYVIGTPMVSIRLANLQGVQSHNSDRDIW
ncbi:MAG: hypothetical protein KGL26_03175, partial [Pseudomonadota bacterium]|nr:hypothetical protein [Pseudomonadota bacterium]